MPQRSDENAVQNRPWGSNFTTKISPNDYDHRRSSTSNLQPLGPRPIYTESVTSATVEGYFSSFLTVAEYQTGRCWHACGETSLSAQDDPGSSPASARLAWAWSLYPGFLRQNTTFGKNYCFPLFGVSRELKICIWGKKKHHNKHIGPRVPACSRDALQREISIVVGKGLFYAITKWSPSTDTAKFWENYRYCLLEASFG